MGKVLPAKAVLERAFPVRVTSNLRGARWTKLAFNCALSTLCAVSGLDSGALAARRDARRLAPPTVAAPTAGAEKRPGPLAQAGALAPPWSCPGPSPARAT